MVEGAIDQASAQDNEGGVGDILGQFTSGQGNKLQGLFGVLGGNSEGMEGRASEKGMDPSLITGMLSLLGGGAGGGADSGGGFNMGSLLQVHLETWKINVSEINKLVWYEFYSNILLIIMSA